MLEYDESTMTARIVRADKSVFTLRNVTRAEADKFYRNYSGGLASGSVQRSNGDIIEHRMGQAC